MGSATKEKKTDWELQYLSLVVKQYSDGIAVADLDGKLLFVNPACAKMHGYATYKGLIGKHLRIFHNKRQLKEDLMPIIGKAKKSGSYSGEIDHIRKDGTVFPTSTILFLLKNNTGKPAALVGIIKDITKQKKAEEELRVEKKKLQDIMDNMIDGITMLDMKGRIKYMNKAAVKQIGFSLKEAKGRTPADLFIEKRDLPKFMESVKKIFSGKSIKTQEYVARRKNGKHFPASVNISPQFDLNGKPVALIAVHRDITLRKKAEEERISNAEALANANVKAAELVEKLRESHQMLEKKVDELERWRKFTVDRELKMIDLKKKIKELEGNKK